MTYSRRAAVALIGSALILAIACSFAKNRAGGPPPGGEPAEADQLGGGDGHLHCQPVDS
jgi:hypothetical protein